MEIQVKLAAALPKTMDTNGLGDQHTNRKLYQEKIRSGTVPPRVAIVVFGDIEAARTKDGEGRVTHTIAWIEPVTSDDARRVVEKMLPEEHSRRTSAFVLPHELATLLRDAFADLPVTDEQRDEREERERERMTPADELRRHLDVVHGIDGTAVLTETEAAAKHQAEHDGGDLGPLEHRAEWTGWSRADLEAEEFAADDRGDVDSAALAANGDAFDDEAEAATGGLDEDYGRDLDDEDDDR